nr:hypothetical protein Q903MT_gene3699 [Picea sitchensis]
MVFTLASPPDVPNKSAFFSVGPSFVRTIVAEYYRDQSIWMLFLELPQEGD